MDLSNKALALILVAAIVVSLGGTLVSLDKLSSLGGITGYATTTDTGTAQLTINGSVVITFVNNSIDWGTGYTNTTGAGIQYCEMDSEGTMGANCTDFTTVSDGFWIRNDGNVNVTLELLSNTTAAQFLGGTSPELQWKLSDATGVDGCPGAARNATLASYVDVSTSYVYACGGSGSYKFDWTDGSDSIILHTRVYIPEDANTGGHSATITARGVSS